MENILFKISFPAEFHTQTAVECAMKRHPVVKERLDNIERVVLETQESVRGDHWNEGSCYSPTAKITDKYAATIIVTTDGRVVRVRIQAETNDVIILRGQESFAEAKKILKTDIEDRVLSKVSMMPDGTINHLQRDEILGLLAYVMAGGVESE